MTARLAPPVQVGTLTGLQWGIYDAFKVFVGLCAPPLPPNVALGVSPCTQFSLYSVVQARHRRQEVSALVFLLWADNGEVPAPVDSSCKDEPRHAAHGTAARLAGRWSYLGWLPADRVHRRGGGDDFSSFTSTTTIVFHRSNSSYSIDDDRHGGGGGVVFVNLRSSTIAKKKGEAAADSATIMSRRYSVAWWQEAAGGFLRLAAAGHHRAVAAAAPVLLLVATPSTSVVTTTVSS